MWNRIMSSAYAHFVTAVAVTLGLVFVLLTGHPGKSNMAKVNVSAQKALPYAARPALASRTMVRDDRPVGASFDYSAAPRRPGDR